MKTWIRLSLLFFLGALAYGFCMEEKTVQQEPKTSLLWKIEGNGLRQPSYLFGTMHMIQKDYFYFPASLEKLIKKSDVIVTEIALDKMSDQSEALKHIYLKEGQLLDFFTPEQQDTLLRWAESKLMMKKDAFLAAFGRMKPFVILQTMIQLNFFGKTESYEMKIKEIADKNDIPFMGFESVEEQISFFDGLSKAEQAEMVLEGIRDEKKNIDLLLNMQSVYKRQQLDSLYYLMDDEGGVISDRQNTFVDERNIRWISQIKDIIHSKKAFIAVGAGHLAGDQGVIELLRKEGYTLTPIVF